MKYTELKQHIAKAMQSGFAPLYCVYGDDDCLCSKALKMFEGIVSLDYADFNLIKISDENDVDMAIDALSTFPMFDEYKVVILAVQNVVAKSKKKFSEDEGEAQSHVKDAIDEYMQSPNPTSVLVINCASKDVASAFKYKTAQTVDCSRLDEESLKREIVAIASAEPKMDIQPQAVSELILRTQSSMGRIESEMAKLKAYSSGVITYRDVCDMVVADTDYKMYEFANAVSQKNCEGALKVLNVLMENGLRGATILNLLYGKYREMLHASLNKDLSNDDLARLLGMSKSGAVYYLKQVASNYSQMRLKKSVDYLHALQYDVLMGKRNETSAVHEAVLQLITI